MSLATIASFLTDPRTYLRDVLLRIAREKDVTKLTPRAWKQHFADEVEAHRNSILERIVNALV